MEANQPTQKKPLGGKRPGAGRPKGARNKQTLALLGLTGRKGPTPLEVIEEVMIKRRKAGDENGMLAAAAIAAPYRHPKLTSVTASGPGGGPIPFADVGALSRLPDEDLARAIEVAAKLSALGGAPGGAGEADGGEGTEEGRG